jgi:2-phospho-L-lactate guanylyltransferase
MRTLAVLPVKSFGRAKQRLGDAVADRPELAAAMVGDVLEALGEVRGLDGVLVVTADPALAAPEGQSPAASGARGAAAPGASAAAAPGARASATPRRTAPAAFELVHDPLEAGQSPAAARGVREAAARGADRVLLVPGDCPALDPAEVDDLLATAEPGVVIVPDRHGSGTNALLIAPPEAITPAFGPGSFARHAALARAAGARVRVERLPSLELDVDTPGDLAALRAALAGRPGVAPRTRALLERLAPAAAR